MHALVLLTALSLGQAGPSQRAQPRDLLRAFLAARSAGELEREAEVGSAIEDERASAGEPWRELLERALAWSDDEIAELHALEDRLRELRQASDLPAQPEIAALLDAAEASGAD